jgi:transposase
MQSYSQDLRDRVLRALERGDRPTHIAERFEVSREWVYDVKNRFEKEGLRHRLPMGGYRVSRVADKESLICGWIKERADLTLAEISERLAAYGVTITPSALWYQLDKWNLSFKKNAARQRARTRRREAGASAMERTAART